MNDNYEITPLLPKWFIWCMVAVLAYIVIVCFASGKADTKEALDGLTSPVQMEGL